MAIIELKVDRVGMYAGGAGVQKFHPPAGDPSREHVNHLGAVHRVENQHPGKP